MFNFKQIRKYDSEIYVFEFDPIKYNSQITFGEKNKLEPLSKIKHSWYEQNGYYEIAKINLGFFWGSDEHLGLVMHDSGIIDYQENHAMECYLDKKKNFIIDDLTENNTKSLMKNVHWGGSLSYALIINGNIDLRKSENYYHATQNHPRTLIGQKADKTMLLVVSDGRGKNNSKGLTAKESAQLMFDLGCINAINADGGGSTQMMLRDNKGMKIVNSPSDGGERSVGTALIVFSKDKEVVLKEMIKKKRLCLDAGHGSDTYKRTGGKGVPGFEEHTFDAKVVEYAKLLAEYNDFEVYLSQPLNQPEIELGQRIKNINNENLDLLFSFHADANTDLNAKGHWGFYWHTSKNGKRLAEIWNKNAVILPNPSRGVLESKPNSWTNFAMVRDTNPVAILMEHAFMTNKDDLELLKSDEFRRKCAEVAIKSACEYFDMEFKLPSDYYKKETKEQPKQETPKQSDTNQQQSTSTVDFLISKGIIKNVPSDLSKPISYGETFELLKRILERIEK